MVTWSVPDMGYRSASGASYFIGMGLPLKLSTNWSIQSLSPPAMLDHIMPFSSDVCPPEAASIGAKYDWRTSIQGLEVVGEETHERRWIGICLLLFTGKRVLGPRAGFWKDTQVAEETRCQVFTAFAWLTSLIMQ